jgi:N-acetylneuraminic acid mutarotase
MNIKIVTVRILAIAALLVASTQVFISCKEDEPKPVPTIVSFTPASALEGANVVIAGTNFSANKSENTVKINGTEASVSDATATQLTITVPAGTTTGKITVEVDGQMATSEDDFTFIPTVTITGFAPASGGPGVTVLITGTNFSASLTGNIVNFNGITATVTEATSTSITTVVPEGATTGKITVTLSSQTISTDKNFVFVPLPTAPTITGFSPEAAAEGTVVIITGTNFSTTGAANVVKFNGIDAAVTNATATQITTTVPAGATTGKVTVKVGQETGGSTVDFVVLVPKITGFAPATGAEGTVVVITGANFMTAVFDPLVKFNGIEATITNATATQITTKVPAGATTGKVTVKVGQATGESSFDFVVVVPTITGFSPATAVEGTAVVITGTNFNTTGSANLVKFNGIEAVVTNATTTEITTAVPVGATTGKVTVKVGQATAVESTADFVVVVPTITGFTPASASVGASVVITGTNFSPSSIVKFNGVAADITNSTATQITATVPATVTTGKITVQVGSKTVTSINDFTPLVLPTVTSFNPFGAIGKTVTVIGTQFDPVNATIVVTFNGTPAVITESSSTQLVVIVPYGATTGPLKVTMDGTEVTQTSPGIFTMISSWTQKTSFPGDDRHSAFSFARNGSGYVGGGAGTNWLTDFYEFDPAGAGTWQIRGSLPAGGIYASASFVFNTVGAAIGDGGDVFSYSPNANQWTYINTVSVQNGAAGFSTVFTLDGQVYVKNVDGAMNAYGYSSPVPLVTGMPAYSEGTSSSQSSFVIGSTAYVGGGNESFTTNVPFNTFYKFTFANGWTKLNNLPVTGIVTMFSVSGIGYLKQGRALYRYNTTTDSWTRLEDAPATIQNSQVAFVIGTQAYIGLNVLNSTGSKELWAFTPPN